MKKLTEFWQRYASGQLTCFEDFKKAVAKERWADDQNTSVERFLDQYAPGEIWQGPERLRRTSAFFTSEPMLKLHDRADWQLCSDPLKLFAARYVEAARKLGIPLYVHSAFRTEEEQAALHKKGRSRAVYPFASHCQGKAVDVVHASYHWMLSNDEWAFLGRLGKDVADRTGIEMTWGGDWSFYDPAHWEIKDWRKSVTEARSGAPVRYTPRGLLRVLK